MRMLDIINTRRAFYKGSKPNSLLLGCCLLKNDDVKYLESINLLTTLFDLQELEINFFARNTNKLAKEKINFTFLNTAPYSLSSLKILGKDGCKKLDKIIIENFEAISHNVNLKKLVLFRINIQNLIPISQLHNLNKLNLGGIPNLIDLSPILQLPHLSQLSLKELPNVTNLPLIMGLKKIESLELVNMSNHIPCVLDGFEFPCLKTLKLGKINLKKTNIINLIHIHELSISKITNLKYLEDFNLRDLKFLSIGNMTGIKVSKTNKTDIKLKSLFIESMYNKAFDLKSIIAFSNSLGSLQLSKEFNHGQYKNIEVIGSLKKLTALKVYIENVNNIDFLAELTNLNFLHLGININNISAIQNLKNLTSLHIYIDYLNDISVIKNLKNLLSLTLNTSDYLSFNYQIWEKRHVFIKEIFNILKSPIMMLYGNHMSDSTHEEALGEIFNDILDCHCKYNNQLFNATIYSILFRMFDSNQLSYIKKITYLQHPLIFNFFKTLSDSFNEGIKQIDKAETNTYQRKIYVKKLTIVNKYFSCFPNSSNIDLMNGKYISKLIKEKIIKVSHLKEEYRKLGNLEKYEKYYDTNQKFQLLNKIGLNIWDTISKFLNIIDKSNLCNAFMEDIHFIKCDNLSDTAYRLTQKLTDDFLSSPTARKKLKLSSDYDTEQPTDLFNNDPMEIEYPSKLSIQSTQSDTPSIEDY